MLAWALVVFESHEDGLVMIHSVVSVILYLKFLIESVIETWNGSVGLRGVEWGALHEHGKGQMGLRIWTHLKRTWQTDPEYHLLVRKDIEIHLASQLFMNHCERHARLIKKSGVTFVTLWIMHEVQSRLSCKSKFRRRQVYKLTDRKFTNVLRTTLSCELIDCQLHQKSCVHKLENCKIHVWDEWRIARVSWIMREDREPESFQTQ